MTEDRLISYIKANGIGLSSINDILSILGLSDGLSVNLKISDSDKNFLDKLFSSKEVEEYYRALETLGASMRAIKESVSIKNIRLTEASEIEKRVYFDVISKPYKKRLLDWGIVDSLYYSSQNLKLITDIITLEKEVSTSDYYGDYAQDEYQSNEHHLDINEIDMNSIDESAKKYEFKKIVEANKDIITRHHIISPLEYSESSFLKLFIIEKGEGFDEYIRMERERERMQRNSIDDEGIVMSALRNGYGDALGF